VRLEASAPTIGDWLVGEFRWQKAGWVPSEKMLDVITSGRVVGLHVIVQVVRVEGLNRNGAT
jgi:hypothetical protein